MSSYKIKFIASNDRVFEIGYPPEPYVKNIPEWYRKMPSVMKNAPMGDLTAKLCQPFMDSMTSGYILKIPAAVLVKKVEGMQSIEWNVSFPVADTINQDAYQGFNIPESYDPTIFRWINEWQIKTPRGYSSLITHPSQQIDLPFYTLPAVVDTDRHPNPILFPFLINKDFEGIIPAGTPIAQVVPLKRDSWESEILSAEHANKFGADLMKIDFNRYYKKHIWSKKRYQ